MIDWDKGKAVTFLLESLGELGCFLFRTWLLYLKSEFFFVFAASDVRNIIFQGLAIVMMYSLYILEMIVQMKMHLR